MTFAERIKEIRLKANMTQEQFGEALGITKRTIINYESGSRVPKDMGFYKKVSERFGIPFESLLDERDEFIAKAYAEGGEREKRKAEELVAEAGALFAGGELSDEDKTAVFMALQEAYWTTKKLNKKYAPKRGKK